MACPWRHRSQGLQALQKLQLRSSQEIYWSLSDFDAEGEKTWFPSDFLYTGVGKCPNWTSPKYWGYNFQQIFEGDVQNPQKGTFTNPWYTNLGINSKMSTILWHTFYPSVSPFKGPYLTHSFPSGFCAACAEAISVIGADLWHCPRTP